MDDFKRGDMVVLRFGSIAVLAEVGIASPNGDSLFVSWEEPVPYRLLGSPETMAMCFGGLPLLRVDGVYRCVFDNQVVTLERAQ